MALVTASQHFVAASRIPVLPTSTSAGAAYGKALGAGGLGLVTEDLSTPLYYIAANLLGRAIELVAEQSGLRTASILPLGSYIAQYFESNNSRFAALAEAFGGHGILPVARRWFWTTDDEPMEPSPERRVFAVRDATGLVAGWLISPDYLTSAVRTPRPTFTCKICNFVNDEPDSNVCINCGSDIW